jgi:hypothetical protein
VSTTAAGTSTANVALVAGEPRVAQVRLLGPRRCGLVVAFDPGRGLGTLCEAGSHRSYGFHCVEIADGSRTVPVGTEVSFAVRAGLLGRLEAADLRPVPSR